MVETEGLLDNMDEGESAAEGGSAPSSGGQPNVTNQRSARLVRACAAFALACTLMVVLDVMLGRSAGRKKRRNLSQNPLPTMLKERQIQNYVDGMALMLNVHVTHHGGTTFCHKIGRLGPTPEFACMGGENWPENITKSVSWPYNRTAPMVERLRPYFHMISWEYRSWANLHRTNWEYDHLLSVIIMRHPIDRFLAKGKCHKHSVFYPMDEDKIPPELWWEYANANCADNYALKILSPDPGCCNGANTSLHHLEGAKDLLRRFTFVVDQACLDDSIMALGQTLKLSVGDLSKNWLKRTHPPAQERIANDTLYFYLLEKFQLDIELYEWSKSLSIVKCS